MPKLHFKRCMFIPNDNPLYNKVIDPSEPDKILFEDIQYGFIRLVSSLDTKLDLTNKTYEISTEEKRQMDLAIHTIQQLNTDALRNKDTVLYLTTPEGQYLVDKTSPKKEPLRIAVEGPHIVLYGNIERHGTTTLSTKDQTPRIIGEVLFQYLNKGYVLTRKAPEIVTYWKQEPLEI